MNKETVRSAPPHSAKLIESLRGIGYTTGTALADIVDNCITAGATRVDIAFEWKERESFIYIFDDGRGMNEERLFEAMRLGHTDSHAARDIKDLGRFGMGMKTASFSQCSRLTVMSRAEGEKTAVYCWDLDYLAKESNGEWLMVKKPSEVAASLLPLLEDAGHGTVVVWEKLDRIVSSGFGRDDFLKKIDEVDEHLGMTFQRYLEGDNPRLALYINSRKGSNVGKVEPVDPFYSSSPQTWRTLTAKFKTHSGVVSVRGYVLPHKDRLSASEYELLGGVRGWASSQGFYIYRNDRLILAGDWLGLGRGRGWSKSEAYRLARISIDIPNTSDEEWKLDIAKSKAEVPAALQNRLAKFAETVRAEAKKVYDKRGPRRDPGRHGNDSPLWVKELTSDGVELRISRDHPFVAELLELHEPLLGKVKNLLNLLEKNVPSVLLAGGGSTETSGTDTGFPSENIPEGMVAVIRKVYRCYLEQGLSPAEARDMLRKHSSFRQFQHVIDELSDSI